jgi:hypothetical protein
MANGTHYDPALAQTTPGDPPRAPGVERLERVHTGRTTLDPPQGSTRLSVQSSAAECAGVGWFGGHGAHMFEFAGVRGFC